MSDLSGGEIISRILRAQGVTRVFGLPDGTYLSLLSAFKNNGIELITPRHESTAAHMAGAYARLNNGLGVCIASNGPGVANILPGIAVENAEGNRVLLITSSRRSSVTHPDRAGTFQYFDQVAVTTPITKWASSAYQIDRIPELMSKALIECYTGRPGVVHVDVPEDIFASTASLPKTWRPIGYEPHHPGPDRELVEQAADLLIGAEMPSIHAGGGILHAAAGEELMQVAELLNAPVITSWSGRGSVPEYSNLVWPMVYIKSCTTLRNASDVVLCIGSRLGETDFWAKAPYWSPPDEQKLIRVDIDERALASNRPPTLPIVSDAKAFLSALFGVLSERRVEIDRDKREKNLQTFSEEKEKELEKLQSKLDDTSSPMLTAHVPATCLQVFNDDAVAVFDGGNTTVWAQYYHAVRTANTLLSTPHFGHLGAGVGQTLGAAVARPDSRIYCIIGDGAFGFHLQEIETAVRHKLPVTFLVICDRQWGMVKMTQQFALRPVKTLIHGTFGPEETIGTELSEIRYDKLAEAMGAYGEWVSDPAELPRVLHRCIEANRCSVVHVEVDPQKHLWAPGLRAFKKMHQEPSGR